MNGYLLLGIALLGVSAYVPFATAARTARLELRADQVATTLLEATLDRPLGIGPSDVPNVLARFHALARRDGVHVADLEVVEPPLAGTLLTLRSNHYAFHLAVSAPEIPSAHRDARDAYEVVAWPLAAIGPAHSAFFLPDDSLRSYSRNLYRGYHGFDDARPLPGRHHRRRSALFDLPKAYRSRDDERWLAY